MSSIPQLQAKPQPEIKSRQQRLVEVTDFQYLKTKYDKGREEVEAELDPNITKTERRQIAREIAITETVLEMEEELFAVGLLTQEAPPAPVKKWWEFWK